MVNVQSFALKFGALQFQRFDDTLLFTKLNHHMLLAALFRKTCVFHFTGTCKMREYLVQFPIGRYIDDNDCATNFLNFSCVIIDWQRWIFGQIVLLQFGVVRLHNLCMRKAKIDIQNSRKAEKGQQNTIPDTDVHLRCD